jgi:D-arabinose 1-dehydrogenase-like Zn-dependent alcohol dehydrogenase
VTPLIGVTGITTYNPIKTGGAGPGKKVAIVGVGGLGHFAIQVSLGPDFSTIDGELLNSPCV